MTPFSEVTRVMSIGETTFQCAWCQKRKPLSQLGARMTKNRCKCKACIDKTTPGGLPKAA